jgi:hypothetical protein
VVDSLKALDLKWPIREADITRGDPGHRLHHAENDTIASWAEGGGSDHPLFQAGLETIDKDAGGFWPMSSMTAEDPSLIM